MEAEVDVERNAQVQDDVPGQDAVKAQVEGHHDGLADLEERDYPQGQVAHQQEGHHGAPRLALHLHTHTHTRRIDNGLLMPSQPRHVRVTPDTILFLKINFS